jgi:membrane-anchored protein YejM (alkaline phosphatase superfamily)
MNKNISLFFKVNLFFTTLIYLAFLLFNQGQSLSTLLFSIFAAISTSATLYLIFYLLFRPFFSFSKSMRLLLSLLFFFLNFTLIADIIIFKVWKFHINAMVINIITSPAAWDSLQIGASTFMIAALIILGLLFGEYFLYKLIQNTQKTRVLDYNRSFNRIVLPLLLLIVIGEKIFFGMADVYNKEPILESVKPIPLYQPLTFARFVEKHLGIKAVEKEANKLTLSNKDSKVHYPLHPLKLKSDAKSPNIFIFMFDAARNSILSEEVSPHIMQFSKEALRFENHISGGDATRFGIFSFFYGLNATYWFNFLHAAKEPFLFQVLKEKKYQTKIISSTNTKWPEFKQTVYCGLHECIEDDFEGSPYEKDRQSSGVFKRWIETVDTNNPLFSFVFLDAPHGYSYPKAFEKFKPNAGNNGLNYLSIEKKNREKLINSYKNAVHYNDKLFGDMIDSLKEKGLYKDAIIIFSSDHGQEFFEYGFFGHNSSFSKAQVNAPFIMKLPDGKAGIIHKMTSHLDVPATLLSFLGVENPPSDYSCGTNILDKNYTREYCCVAKWNKNAILTQAYTHIYSNLPNEIFNSEVRENETYKKVKKKTDDNIETVLLKVLEENRRFLY